MIVNTYNKIFNNWQNFANQEVEFFSTDTNELYQSNLKNNIVQMKLFGWDTAKFTYKFNSQGFRCPEFESDSILFLGCSITQGIGMPVEEIFPSIVSDKLKMPCVNLGIERSSANTAFRLAYHFLPKLKPKICVATLLYPHRLELLTMNQAIHFIPNHKFQERNSYTQQYYVEYYSKWIQESANYELNYLKNILALHQLCDQYNIKFINFSDVVDQKKAIVMMGSMSSRARDMLHPGKVIHQEMAEEIIKVL